MTTTIGRRTKSGGGLIFGRFFPLDAAAAHCEPRLAVDRSERRRPISAPKLTDAKRSEPREPPICHCEVGKTVAPQSTCRRRRRCRIELMERIGRVSSCLCSLARRGRPNRTTIYSLWRNLLPALESRLAYLACLFTCAANRVRTTAAIDTGWRRQSAGDDDDDEPSELV